MNPEYPVYIVSRGRWESRLTSKALESMGIPYFIIVDGDEYSKYCDVIDKSKILVTPINFVEEYDTFWKDDDPRVGVGACRNFAWEHSIETGFDWHWVMDDNLDAFHRYDGVNKAEVTSGTIFKSMEDNYEDFVRCEIRCADCCHAVFGLLPIEAAYINYHFNRIERKARRDILRRAEKAETEMLKAKDTLKVFEDNPKMKVFGLGKQRVRCPFLSDKKECVFYDKRPVICRIYGVPYSLKQDKKERSYVCGLSGFETKATYPTVKLDNIYNEFVRLSKELFTEAGYLNPAAKATLMLPLARVLRMPFEDIMQGNFEE